MRDISHVLPGFLSWQEFQYVVGVSYHLEDPKLNCWEDYEEILPESVECYEAIWVTCLVKHWRILHWREIEMSSCLCLLFCYA